MSPTTALLEQSFLDLIAAIERASELSGERRRHWVCSLQQIANWLDRPAAVIPARWNAVQIEVGQLHHARLGVTSKTLANHRSNVRAALRWFGQEQGVPQRGARLSAKVGEVLRPDRCPHAGPPVQPDTLLLGPRHRPSRGR